MCPAEHQGLASHHRELAAYITLRVPGLGGWLSAAALTDYVLCILQGRIQTSEHSFVEMCSTFTPSQSQNIPSGRILD